MINVVNPNAIVYHKTSPMEVYGIGYSSMILYDWDDVFHAPSHGLVSGWFMAVGLPHNESTLW